MRQEEKRQDGMSGKTIVLDENILPGSNFPLATIRWLWRLRHIRRNVIAPYALPGMEIIAVDL